MNRWQSLKKFTRGKRILIAFPILGLCLAGVTFGKSKFVVRDTLNNPPPAGAILDLAGTPIPGGGNSTFQFYSVNFVAVLPNTQITFAWREDPSYFYVQNFSVTDLTVPGPNLLVDGDLTGGTNNSNQVPGWTYANVYGASASGVVDKPCSIPGGPTPAACWDDGAVGAYDALTQVIPTVVGHTYRISFSMADDSDCNTNFTQLKSGSNSCTGIDMLVYAQAGLPSAGGSSVPTTPAPASLGLLLSALGVLAVWQLRKRMA